MDQQLDVDGCQLQGAANGTDTTTTAPTTTVMDPSITTTIEPDTTVTDGGTETSTTTGEPQSCMSDEECTEGNVVFCSPVLQECVNCTGMPDPEAACEGRDPTLPACADGECVQCAGDVTSQCAGETPVCNEETNMCMPCSEHEQCGMAACNLFTGACVEGPVVTVGPGQTYGILTDAVDNLLGGGGGTIIVHQDLYDEVVVVDGGAIVAFLANGSDRPTWQRTGGVAAPQLRVTGDATVLMEGFDLRSNPATLQPALQVDGASLWIDRGIIAQQSGTALRSENSAEVVLRNCFIGGANDLPALSALASSLTLEYTTVGAGLGATLAVSCDGGSAVTVTDSILISRGSGAEVDCPPLTATRSASNTALPGGASNVEVGATMTAWFASYIEGDLHLTPGGQAVFADIAEWNDGDPLVDIDDAPRSGVDGTPEHAGADVP